MNERIRELERQATETVKCGLNGTSTTESFNRKKFAELIVRECINKIETHRIPVGNSTAGEMACEWTYAALKEIRDEIKEHFGL
jgi:hypothetical protein